jgi:hypothetical protein
MDDNKGMPDALVQPHEMNITVTVPLTADLKASPGLFTRAMCAVNPSTRICILENRVKFLIKKSFLAALKAFY